MRVSDFDREFAARRRRMDRWMRINAALGLIVFALVLAAVVVGVYLLVTSPEQIGAWFGRLASGFEAR